MDTPNRNIVCTNAAEPAFSEALSDRTVGEIKALESLKPESLEPDELRRLIRMLDMRLTELETQNAELRQTQAELIAERERYFNFYNLAPLGYVSVNRQGLILKANPCMADLLGISQNDLMDQPITRFIHSKSIDSYERYRKQLFETHEPQTFELLMARMDETGFGARLSMFTAQDARGALICRMAVIDITARRFQEEQDQLTAQLIALINHPEEFRRNISQLAASLHEWSDCEAIGIRLKDGDDYPYYETRGFPPEFVRLENNLCSYGPDGAIRRDAEGRPMLDCMCGNVLSGRFDPAKSFFTINGSFCANTTTRLLATTTETDRHARTRNRCNGSGYESVALIPIRTDTRVFGLIQLNDHRPNRFSSNMITHFEKMADRLAIAMSRHQAEKELLESKAALEERVRNAVNELRQKDQALIQQSRMAAMGEMIGNIAHQWRQPLNTLGLIVANIQDAYQFNELNAEYMDHAVADCHRLIQKMSSTISDFFHFFRPEKAVSVFSARRQVEMAISLVQASFAHHNIAIHFETVKDAQLLGFSNEYSQALLNLLSNARDAILAQKCAAGRVDICIETTDRMGCVVVRDNGGGIPKEILDKIFDPYFTTRPQGTGIGLYMSKMIVERNMNGVITARNVAGGAEFAVCVPLANDQAIMQC